MAKTTDSTTLEQLVQTIVSRAAEGIAHAVRADIADQVNRIVGGSGAPSASPSAKASVAKPGARTTARPATQSTARATTGRRKRRGSKQGADASVLSNILRLIAATPGLRNEQIRAQLAMNAADVKAALAELRASNRVKTRGTRRATAYHPAQ